MISYANMLCGQRAREHLSAYLDVHAAVVCRI